MASRNPSAMSTFSGSSVAASCPVTSPTPSPTDSTATPPVVLTIFPKALGLGISFLNSLPQKIAVRVSIAPVAKPFLNASFLISDMKFSSIRTAISCLGSDISIPVFCIS